MIPLVMNQSNIVGLKVNAPESLSGFSVSLSACGTVKTAITNDKGEATFTFSSANVASVTTDKCGEYGTMIITDTSGIVRIKVLPCFRAVEEDVAFSNKDRMIFVTIPQKINTPSGGGGDSPDLSAYATKKELNEANTANKQYTDEKISDIGATIIAEQSVTVTGEDGEEKQLTVQQAVQNVVDMQTQVSQVVDHDVSWEVKDEDEDGQPDGGILYFKKGKKD